MEDVIQQIIDEILLKAQSTIEEFERDNEKHPLFELNYDENGDFSEITFNDSIMVFFGLLLGCRNFGKSFSSKSSVTERDLNKFLHFYFSDVKMSLLKDAIVNLANYFEANSGNTKIEKELFYDFITFKKEVDSYISLTGLADLDELITVLNDHQDTIHLKVPKICFPWYIYSLCHTYKKFPKWTSGKKYNIVNGEFLALKWTRSEYPKEREIIEQAQKNFRIFIQSLAGSVSGESYNRSLNMSLFNETTNLYDIYNLVNLFRDGSPYMKYQNLQLKYKRKTIDDKDYKERNMYKRQLFEGVSYIAAINMLGVKTLLIDDYYSEKLFTDERVWNVFNKIFNLTKQGLLKVVKENQISEHSDVPENIRLDYFVYSLLNKEEPFDGHLKDILESGLHIYVPSKDEIEIHLYEAYFSAYKNFYERRYKGKKGNTVLKY